MRKRDGKKNLKIKTPAILQEQVLPLENKDEKPLTEEEVKEIIEKQEINQNQLDEAEQQVAKQKSKKKKILNFVFFLINIGVVIAILVNQLTTQEVMPISTLFTSGLNLWFILLTLVVFGLYMVCGAARINTLVKHSTGRSRPFLSYKTVAIGRHYDVITPMATGGQPFQIMYLKNRGLSASAAISVPMGNYVLSQIASIIMCAIVLILATTTNVIGGVTVVSVAFYVGFSLNFLLSFVIIFLSISKSVGKKLVGWTLKFLRKIKIVKNYEKQYNKVLKVVSDYQATIQNYAKSKWTFVYLLFISLIQFILTFIIPFTITCAFLGWRPDLFLEIFIMGVMVDVAASFIPLPGGTGVSELSFTALFGQFFKDGTLFWALIIWRIMSYYIFMIQGVGIIMYDYFVGNKKYTWLKRKWELEAESIEFREQKLKNYKKERNKLLK